MIQKWAPDLPKIIDFPLFFEGFGGIRFFQVYVDLGAILGASWDHLGAILGLSFSHLGHLGTILEPSWDILGHLGAILGHLGAILGSSWDDLGLFLGYLCPSLPQC